MSFVYLTAQKYPSKKVDPFYRRQLAGGFAHTLRGDFSFVIRGVAPPELSGLNPISVAAPRRFKTIFYFFTIPFLVLRRGWRSEETIFFSYDPYLSIILLFWRKVFFARYRVVFDWHQLFEDWRDRVLAHCDKHTTTSKRLGRLLVERYNIPEARICVAYGGVDPQPFIEKARTPQGELRAQLGLPQESFIVGYVGGFTSVGLKKGLDTMLQALAHLPKEIVMAFVGGSQKEIEEYEMLAHGLGVGDRCTFVRYQPFGRVIEYQLAMNVLCIPYPDLPHFREWGFPLKVWEYMASGRPIVYSNLELVGEVLEGRAVPFAPGSPESLAEAVMRIYKDRVGEEARAAQNPGALSEYTWDARAQKIVDFSKH